MLRYAYIIHKGGFNSTFILIWYIEYQILNGTYHPSIPELSSGFCVGEDPRGSSPMRKRIPCGVVCRTKRRDKMNLRKHKYSKLLLFFLNEFLIRWTGELLI